MAITERSASPPTVLVHELEAEVKSSPSKRRVRFAESNTEYINTVWCKEDTTVSSWFSREELRQFKRDYRQLAQGLQRREAAMRNRCAKSYGNVMIRLFQACCYRASGSIHSAVPLLNADDRSILLERTARSHGRVGLDTVHDLCMDRIWRKHQYWQGANTGKPETCRAVSAPSSLLAQYMAAILEESLLLEQEQLA